MERDASERPWIERVVASRPVRSLYVSLVTHAAVGLILAMLMLHRPGSRPLILELSFNALPASPAEPLKIGTSAGPVPDPGPAASEPQADEQPIEKATAAARADRKRAATSPLTTESPTPAAVATPASSAAGPPPASIARSPARAAAAGDRSSPVPAAYASRRGEGRQQGVARHGGSAASEEAVAAGLRWLARHQAADGSWRFDLSGCRCDGACRQRGTVTSTTAATGIALLPFLGAGHTQAEGTHRETVTRGLYYLMSRMRATPRGGDLSEGTMYGHGVATLALAEALGMTGDRMLAAYVRDAVRFIETSQDLHGGGWRYLPGQAGDTTVTAWQLAALKSAALAGVAVPSPTIDGVCRFLDRVEVRDGAGYGYLSPQDRRCTSAIGLLCRIYTAWPEEATIDRGLAHLARRGPDREAIYQNFYLAQALLLRGHPAWKRWNSRNRDQLVARQDRVGHEAGSWSFSDPDTSPGGRLGHTALAILTLEVYYRLLPIYTVEAAERRW